MKKEFVAVLDSGVGGLSVLSKLTKTFPTENFIYLGDNSNAPYGSKSKSELLSITIKNLSLLSKFSLKAVFIACNTLSLKLFQDIKLLSPVPTFFIFPPVESCILKGYKTLLLATPITCSFYKETATLKIFPIKDLAKGIEDNLFHLKDLDISRFIPPIKQKFDAVILGCTHYNFVKNQIFNHLKPLLITDGVDNTINNALKSNLFLKSSVKTLKNQVLFVGENYKINEKFWNSVGKML